MLNMLVFNKKIKLSFSIKNFAFVQLISEYEFSSLINKLLRGVTKSAYLSNKIKKSAHP